MSLPAMLWAASALELHAKMLVLKWKACKIMPHLLHNRRPCSGHRQTHIDGKVAWLGEMADLSNKAVNRLPSC